MKILVIGGTIFLGRHFVNEALAAGHELTLLHRGNSNKGLFKDKVTEILLDRNNDLAGLASQNFDAVIDTCGYTTKTVRHSVNSFWGKVRQYVFVSSVSVYPSFDKIGIDENEEVFALPQNENIDEVNLSNEAYGLLKACCEKEVLNKFNDNALIVRPGLIVGKYDPTDRFSYWVHRISKARDVGYENVLIPQNDFNVQFISAKDLAKWVLHCVEKNINGVFNATSNEEITFSNFLIDCEKVTNKKPNYVSMTNEFIAENEVYPWAELPMYVGDDKAMAGFAKINSSKAVQNGLQFSETKEIIAEVHDFMLGLGNNYVLKSGISNEKEKLLLSKLGY